MVPVARKNLFHSKTKSLLSIAGVAFSVYLIFTVFGVYNAMDHVMGTMVSGTGADVWITQAGTSGSVHSPSLVPRTLMAVVRGMDGVREAEPLIRTTVTWDDARGGNVLLFVNGFEPRGTLGGPWEIAAGSASIVPGTIVIDRSFAEKYGFKLFDTISLRGREFRIVVLSNDTNVMVGYQVFVTDGDATGLLPAGFVNSILVKTQSGENATSLLERLRQALSDERVETSESIARVYKQEVLGSFKPIILVLSLVSLIVGVLVVGLLIYMITLEKAREYGIVKAIGASNGYLYRVVLTQAMLVSIIGFVAGVVITFPAIALMTRTVPEFMARIEPVSIVEAFPVFLASGVVASFIPLHRIVGIDPALVFKQ